MTELKTPRVVIISHNALSKFSNNGKTVFSLFENWPEKNLAQIYFRNEVPDFKSEISYFRIFESDIIQSIFRRKDYCGQSIQNNYNQESSSKKTASSRLQILKTPFFYILRDILWSFKKSSNIDLNNWLDKFTPEIVFFVGSNNTFSYDFVFEIVSKRKIPLVVYFTDDYVLPKISFNPFWWIQNLRVKRKFLQSIKTARKLFVIGDMMKEVYTKKFGSNYLPLMNIVDPPISLKKSKKNSDIEITYLGNLGLNRWQALSEISNEIIKLNNEGLDISFSIYSIEVPAKKILQAINKPPYINFKGSIKDNKRLNSILTNSDIVVHVESKKRKYRNITQLSVSTKISEYLAFGKCILAYGPADVASIKYLKDNRSGIICNTKEEVYFQLRDFALNSDNYKDYALNAKNLYNKNHKRPDMQKILNELVSGC